MKTRKHFLWSVVLALGVLAVGLLGLITMRHPSMVEFCYLQLSHALKGPHTAYPEKFRPWHWDLIHVGMRDSDLYERVGAPLLVGPCAVFETWGYPDKDLSVALVRYTTAPERLHVWECMYADGRPYEDGFPLNGGSTGEDVLDLLGEPESITYDSSNIQLWYSTPVGGLGESDYIIFRVSIDPEFGLVSGKNMSYYYD